MWYWKLQLGVATINGTKIQLSREFLRANPGVVTPGLESEERRLVSELPRDTDVIELGAGIGLVTAEIHSHLNQGQRQVVVEMAPDVVGELFTMLSLYSIDADVLNRAYDIEKDSVEIHTSDKGFIYNKMFYKDKDSEHGIKVSTIDLSTLS